MAGTTASLRRRRAWGKSVRDRRMSLGMGQLALAARTQVAQSTISRIENGVQAPGDELKMRIAKSLKTTVGKLFDFGDAA